MESFLAIQSGPIIFSSLIVVDWFRRQLINGVDYRIKIVDKCAGVFFRACNAYSDQPWKTFNRRRFEILSGYSIAKVNVLPEVTLTPQKELRKADVFIPSLDGSCTMRVRIYNMMSSNSSLNEKVPLLLYFHGGGFVVSHIDSLDYDNVCSSLAHEGFCVVSVEYRLAPEHVFPAAIEDAYASLLWCHASGSLSSPSGRNHALLSNADVGKLIVGGDSAGGNIAVVLSHLARDKLDAHLKATNVALPIWKLLLVYPSVDRFNETSSVVRFRNGYILKADLMNFFKTAYKPLSWSWEEYLRDCRVSPMLNGNFSNLPPTVLVTAALDALVDEGVAYCDALNSSGSPCKHIMVDNTAHGFWTMWFLKETIETMQQVVKLLHE
jgi:acetyl esterase